MNETVTAVAAGRRKMDGSRAPVRPATLDDLGGVNDIYNHYVRTSHVTFDLEPMSRPRDADGSRSTTAPCIACSWRRWMGRWSATRAAAASGPGPATTPRWRP